MNNSHQANINWYPGQHVNTSTAEMGASNSSTAGYAQNVSSKVRNLVHSSVNHNMSNGSGITSADNAQVGSDQQQSAFGLSEQQMALNMKNQRKAAMAARMRPRSQTGNPNAKNANLF